MRYLLLMTIYLTLIGCESAKQINLGTAAQICGTHCVASHPNADIIGVTVNVTTGELNKGVIGKCACKRSDGSTIFINNIKTNEKLIEDVKEE